MASEDTLIGGKVINKATAGPTSHAKRKHCLNDRHFASGRNHEKHSGNSKRRDPKKIVATISGPICGNSQARAAPSNNTSTMYSGTSRTVIRPRIFSQREKSRTRIILIDKTSQRLA